MALCLKALTWMRVGLVIEVDNSPEVVSYDSVHVAYVMYAFFGVWVGRTYPALAFAGVGFGSGFQMASL